MMSRTGRSAVTPFHVKREKISVSVDNLFRFSAFICPNEQATVESDS